MQGDQRAFMAHYRPEDGAIQDVWEHLHNVGVHAETLAEKIRLGPWGKLIGLTHDLGKATQDFDNYIRAAVGLSDAAGTISNGRRTVDHSTAGGQWLQHLLSETPEQRDFKLAAEVLSLLVLSHHGGLLDCLSVDGRSDLARRLEKNREDTRLDEALRNVPDEYLAIVNQLLDENDLEQELNAHFRSLIEPGDCQKTLRFRCGLAIRFLFSTLIDGDRMDTIDFQDPTMAVWRRHTDRPPWDAAVDALEAHLAQFSSDTPVNAIRQDVSSHCLHAAGRDRGLHRLTVPTGGGKTLASLRFALHHAAHHGMERVIYVIPYTSIIDQNAAVIRGILEVDPRCEGMVLEHHSNLDPSERADKKHMLFTQNWDAPIVLTTMVQFLETLFGGGTSSVRRMHAMANSVLVFDEIQTLPIRCVHLFNGALRYLVHHCGASAVLCTATQPLLHAIEPKNRSLPYDRTMELIPDVPKLFAQLKRVSVQDCTQEGPWDGDVLAGRIVEELYEDHSCLLILNTKRDAGEMFRRVRERVGAPVYHLSTNMCPAHRKSVLAEVKKHLEQQNPVVCVSTPLIEAGVDIDFDVVFRALAGLDSIQQAAGRCNRHGRNAVANVYVFELKGESLTHLVDIQEGKTVTQRLLGEFLQNPASLDHDLLSPRAIEQYYHYYFFQRKNMMAYPVSSNSSLGVSTDLFELLSTNDLGAQAYQRKEKSTPPPLRQAFAQAAQLFTVIEQSGSGVIVPYGEEGKDLIAKLCSLDPWERPGPLLAEAQQYSVNVYPHVLQTLGQRNLLHRISETTDIYHVHESAYDKCLGLQQEAEGVLSTLMV